MSIAPSAQSVRRWRVAVLAVVAVVLVIFANQPVEAIISEEALAQYVDVPETVTESGFPVLGSLDAPIQVVEYSSFDCPHCAEFHEQVTPALVERAAAGEIGFTYVPLYGTGGVPNGEGAARAALCAGEQGEFWAYHTALFSWQGLYGNQALSGNRLESGASNLGLDVGAWNACLNSAATNATIVAARGAASSLEGFTGTPTVTVNGEIITSTLGDVNNAIDVALASAPPVIVEPETVEEEPAADESEAVDEAAAETEATEEASE
jgi:protein-disulfide isomerase